MVLPSPVLNFSAGVVQAQKPVRVEALVPETAVDGFDERMVCRRSRTGTIQRYLALVGPQIQHLMYRDGHDEPQRIDEVMTRSPLNLFSPVVAGGAHQPQWF